MQARDMQRVLTSMQQKMAMKRVLHLVEELGAGKVSRTHKNVNTGNSLEPKTFKTSIKKVNGVLGITVPDEDILRILKGLDFDPEINGDGVLRLTFLHTVRYGRIIRIVAGGSDPYVWL